ncbi:hypothetical protein Ahy_B06g081811 isoform A [Arachis hypogaea]|uniref:SWIM-type domain-containing protein n=1 Tax=Arachis hypogaea TaxID=3818 RepID=A0A444YM10_ARAHY|nr:hypothetical protein Ahy_B06g081811 isoform A [Arachis hypogaea]
MDDRVLMKVYYFGQILLETIEGVRFVCENPLDIVIPFTISFEELKGVICELNIMYPIPLFGGFVQFQTKYVTDEASMQEIFLMYIESRGQISFIEVYVEFEPSEADRNIEREDYNSDSEEEFESNYKVVGPDGDEDEGDGNVAPNVADVASALANEHLFEEPSFMRALDLEAMHAPEFLKYMNAAFVVAEILFVADGEFAVDYRVYESEPLTFYAKCTQYGSGCDWLIRVSLMSRKYCWVIRRYNEYSRTVREYGLRYQRNIQVNCFDRQNEVFEVREMPSEVEYAVDLRRQRCDCSEFQVDRIPCRHVFACCANQRLDWQVYVHEVLTVYQARFRPLGNPTTWPAYNGPYFVPNLYLRRVTKCHPRMTCFLNEMDT